MGKAAKRGSQRIPTSQEVIKANNNKSHLQSSWKNMTDQDIVVVHHHHQISCDSTSFDSSTTKEDSSSSVNSFGSSTSSDIMEDASSSSSSSSNGPLYQLSDIMAQLPIKRGLSRYYEGKSQSFTSLASVESLEDLAKRENPYTKRIKLCKSFCGGLSGQRFCRPKTNISKKASSRVSLSSTTTLGRNTSSNNFLVNCRPPPVPVQSFCNTDS